MASRREYEMLFKLNAQQNSGFAATFGKAQQQLLSFQRDIQDLNKAQGDIAAYEKQQQAIESTRKKLETLQQQYDNIQKEIQETGTFSSDLENKLLSKQQQIDKTSAALDRQTQKLDQMDGELREAGVDTGNLTQESARLGAEMDELRRQQEAAADGAQSFGERTAEAFDAAGSAIAAAGITVALQKIYEGYMQCVDAAGGFEASMSNVEALSGVDARELQQLSDMAKELGATTKFTAKESADAMGYMAMAGWDAQQMLAGMPGVLQLAAASGEDLAQVSDIVTDSMTAFGLGAAETSHYADVLAATAASANTSVSIMGETFKTAAPIAGALGYSVEDVSVAIGLMANAGIKGSNAGTALRNVFNGLLNGVTLTGKAFGEVELSAVRADGTMEDLSTTIGKLRGYFDQMTESERASNAAAIAGERGRAGLLNILNASEQDYQKLTAAINNSTGAAQRMADIKMDNMTGQLTRMNSAWEAVQITVGENFTPTLQDLYATGADVLGEVNGFLQANPGLVKSVAAFAGVLGTVVAAVTAVNAGIKIFKALNVASLFSGPAGIIIGLGAAVATVAAAVVALSDNSEQLTVASKRQADELSVLQQEYRLAVSTYGETSAEALRLQYRIDELSDSFEANRKTVQELITESDALIAEHDALMSEYASSAQDIHDEYLNSLSLVTALDDMAASSDNSAGAQARLDKIVSVLSERYPEVAAQLGVISGNTEDVAAAFRAAAEEEQKYAQYSSALEQFSRLTEEQNALTDQLTEARENLNAVMEDAGFLWDEEAQAYRNAVTGAEYAVGVFGSLSPNMKELYSNVEDLTDSLAENGEALEACNAIIDEYAGQTETASGDVKAAITSVTDTVNSLTAAYNEAYGAALSSIQGQYDLWDKADEAVATSAGSINDALQSQIGHWTDYNANLEALRSRTADIEGLGEVIATFADGSKDSVNAVAGMATATDEDLAAMVQNWRDLQKAQKETSEVITEFKTDYTTQMQELTNELTTQIEGLDLSDEAAESGRVTIQGFIQAAANELPRVQAAYRALGEAAAQAMTAAAPSGNLTARAARGQGATFVGFASGTDYAPPGLALVGENGPELVMLQGGEKILTAEETRAMQREIASFTPEFLELIQAYATGTMYADAGLALVGEKGPELVIGPTTPEIPARVDADEVISAPLEMEPNGGGIVVTFSPVYNISSNANSEELEAVLREHDEELKDQLEELLEEIEADKARRAYR